MQVAILYKEDRNRTAGGQFATKYPFDKLRVGKTFTLDLDRDDPSFTKEYSRLRAAAYAFFTRTNKKFQCRQSSDGIEVKRIS